MEGPGGRYTRVTPETTVAWLWGALVGAIVGFIVRNVRGVFLICLQPVLLNAT